MARIAITAAALLVAGIARADAPPQSSVNGFWSTQDGAGVAEIAGCGGNICGWLMGFRDQPPPKDYRGDSECRLEFIFPMKPGNDGKWTGQILNPTTGGIYQAWLIPTAGDTLYLRGYLGLSVFGQTQVWTRFNGHLTPDCRID